MAKLHRFAATALVVAVATAAVASSASCSLVDTGAGKIVADSTLFIVGTLEVSPDTVIHHPQVFVGRLADPENPRYNIYADRDLNLGRELYMPDLWAQVMRKAELLHIRPFPETRATVSVTGPIGQPGERTASFTHEGRGVYGDGAQTLPLATGARYRLDVSLPDGRRYTAETRTPRPYQITVPDVVRSRTEFIYHGPDSWSEIGEIQRLPCTPDPDPTASVTVWNVSKHRVFDAETLLADDWRQLWFSDRGDHLRASSTFRIATPAAYSDGMACNVLWTASTNTSRWDASPLYLRVAQLSGELAGYYQVPFTEYSTPTKPGDPVWDDPWYVAVSTAVSDADRDRDATYLPRHSNIRRVGADGTAAAATDAVGVFGGITARYLTRTIEPIRSFDPDTLDWHYLPGYPNP